MIPDRWLQPKEDAPEWMKGDFPWWGIALFIGPLLVVAGAVIWLTDRTGAAKLLVAVMLAVWLRWLAWVLPRIRRPDPPPSSE